MPWIRVISPKNAAGALKRQYDAAIKRAGKIFNIVSISSLKPHFIQDSMDFYSTLMHQPGKLSRAQREMIAVVVSRANDCFYWTEAHGEDLRAQIGNDEVVELIKQDFRRARLAASDVLMLEYAEKLTKTPSEVTSQDLDRLRQAGFDDEAILEIVHITGFFAYINRVADALGVEPELEWAPPSDD